MKSKMLSIRLTENEKKLIQNLSLENGYGENISQFVRATVFQNNLKSYFQSANLTLKNEIKNIQTENEKLKSEIEDLKKENKENTKVLFESIAFLVKNTKGLTGLSDEAKEVIKNLQK